jgi:hypothetical protein
MVVGVGLGVDAGLDVLVAALLPQAAAMNAIATSKRARRNETFFMKTLLCNASRCEARDLSNYSIHPLNSLRGCQSN